MQVSQCSFQWCSAEVGFVIASVGSRSCPHAGLARWQDAQIRIPAVLLCGITSVTLRGKKQHPASLDWSGRASFITQQSWQGKQLQQQGVRLDKKRSHGQARR